MELSIKQKLVELGVAVESDKWEGFKRLANLTALKHSASGRFHLGHWWRGPLLYGFLLHYKPRHVLEFGTGRGYGALSMALAAENAGLECAIWTIDITPPGQLQPWAIDEGDGAELKRLSLQQVWSKHFSLELTERIHCLTGNSMAVMKSWASNGLPKIDFVFIDGGHDYWTVKHDFIMALSVANPGAVFLFDDYGVRKGYGVKRLIDKEVLSKSPIESVEKIDILPDQSDSPGEPQIEHKMVLLDTEHISNLQEHFYSGDEIRFHMVANYLFHKGRGLLPLFRRVVKPNLRSVEGLQRQK